MHRHARQLQRDDGFTLAEMMVAIFVVGFVLSAMAATLLSTLRATSTNELETRATALGQQELEVLQSVNWEFAALYANDLAAAPERWSDRLDDDGRYDGGELIVLPGPASADERIASVATPTSTFELSGVTYTVDRYVTWVDRVEDGAPDTRRFTSVVTWGDRSADRSITVTAERAPSQGDTTATAAGARVLQMHVTPNPAQLTDDQAVTTELEVRVVLNQASPTSNELHYFTLVDGDWELRKLTPSALSAADLTATADAPNTRFRFVIPAGDRFVAGTQNVLYVGRDAANHPIESSRAVTFEGGDLEGFGMPSPVPPSADDEAPVFGFPPAPPAEGTDDPDEAAVPEQSVRIMSVVTSPKICIDGSTWVPNAPFTIDISVQGAPSPIGAVTVTYSHRVSAGQNGNHPSTTVTDSADFVSGTAGSALYRFTLPTSNRFFWKNDKPTFTIEARRAGDSSNDSTTRTVSVDDKC